MIFRKTLLNVKCLFCFPLQSLYEILLTLRKFQRDTIISLHANYPLFLSDVNENWIFSTDFGKILFNEYLSSGNRVVL